MTYITKCRAYHGRFHAYIERHRDERLGRVSWYAVAHGHGVCCPVRTRQRHTARWMLRVIDSCRTRHVTGANVSTRTYLNRSCFCLFPEIWFPRRIYLCVYMNNSSRTVMCCLLSLRVDNLRRSLAVYSNRQLLH